MAKAKVHNRPVTKTPIKSQMMKPKLKTNIKKKKLLQSTAKSKKILKNVAVTQPKKKEIVQDEPSQKPPGNFVKLPCNKKQIVQDEPSQKPPANFVKLSKLPCNKKQISDGVNTLIKFLKKVESKQELFDEEQPIFLQVTCVKIPQTPIRLLRFDLNHSILTDSAEICLIVADKGNKRDHESTVEYYEEILNKNGINNIKTILPFNQFRAEYGTQYELKRKLLGLYDYFLVDSKVCGFVIHLMGSTFYNSRKMPSAVRMDHPKLKQHFEKVTKKSILKMHSKGDTYNVQVANTHMSELHICENINGVLQDFRLQFPGGVENIRALGIKTAKSILIPIYLTLKNKSTVSVPVCMGPVPKRRKNVYGELSTQNGALVTVTPAGNVRVKEIKQKDILESTSEFSNLKKAIESETDLLQIKPADDDRGLRKAEQEYLRNYEQEQAEAEAEKKELDKKKRKVKKQKTFV